MVDQECVEMVDQGYVAVPTYGAWSVGGHGGRQ